MPHRDGEITGRYMGFPYRGDVVFLKNTDPERQQPQRQAETFVRILDLAEPCDMKEYTEICNRITRGDALLSVEDRQFIPAAKSWVVMIRWVDIWFTSPEEPK